MHNLQQLQINEQNREGFCLDSLLYYCRAFFMGDSMISKLIKRILEKLECNLRDLERYSEIEYSILWRMLNHDQTPTHWEVQQLEKVLSEKTDYKQSYIDKRLHKYKAGVYGYIKGNR